MGSLSPIPETFALSTEYQRPLEQIFEILRREPIPTRLQNISRLQDVLKSIPKLLESSLYIENAPSTNNPKSPWSPPIDPPSCSIERTLPPLYFPSTPHRALQPISSLATTIPTTASLPNTTLTSTTHNTAAIVTAPTPRPHKRRRATRESSIPIEEQEHPVENAEEDSLIQHNPSKTWEANVAISMSCGRQAVTDAAASFQRELQEVRIREKKNNTPITSQVNPADIATLTRFFFIDVFGEGCQKRMFTLIDEIVQRTQHEIPPSTIAKQKADDKTLLPEVQAFFSHYSKWYEKDEQHTRLVPMIARTIRSFELYNSFFQLREKATSPQGQEIRAFLTAQGFQTTRGRDIRTCVLQYLSKELRIDSGALNNILQAQQGIFQLAQQFGKGILVLLPKVASHRITRIGSQKMHKITSILYESIPEAAKLCSAAEFLIPYIKDDAFTNFPSLLGQQVALRSQLSLLDTFTLIRPLDIPSTSLVTT